MKLKYYLSMYCILLLITLSSAQDISQNEVLFLDIIASPSIIGAGNAGTALLGDINGLECNPAAHATTKDYSVAFNHMFWSFDLNCDTLSVIAPSSIGFVSFRGRMLYAPQEEKISFTGVKSGSIGYTTGFAELGIARRVVRNIYCGINAAYLFENDTIASGSGGIVNIGGVYTINSLWNLGAAIKQIGKGPALYGKSATMIPVYRFGITRRIPEITFAKIKALSDVTLQKNGINGFSIGGESAFFDIFNIRIGLQRFGKRLFFTSGAGIQYSFAGANYILDYAFNPHSELQNVHSMQLSFEFIPMSLSAIEYHSIEIEPLFPVMYSKYHDRAVGSVVIFNRSEEPLNNVEVTVTVKKYTDTDYITPTVSKLSPQSSVTLAIYIRPNENVLRINNNKKINAKLTTRYDINGKPQTVSYNHTFTIFSKNAIDWSRESLVGAFVTPNDEIVIQFTREVISHIDPETLKSLNERLIKAMALFDALGALNFKYVADPDSPWNKQQTEDIKLDTVQFPRETLHIKAGDCDDLTVCYATILESVGIPTAFIYTPGHIFMMFDTGLSSYNSGQITQNSDILIVYKSHVWIPVEVTMVGKTFTDAWNEGAAEYYKYYD